MNPLRRIGKRHQRNRLYRKERGILMAAKKQEQKPGSKFKPAAPGTAIVRKKPKGGKK
jgi:hypothetical protein